jgi:hypothetical protein
MAGVVDVMCKSGNLPVVRRVLEMHISICASRLSRRLFGASGCEIKPPRRSERSSRVMTRRVRQFDSFHSSAHLLPRGPRSMIVLGPCAMRTVRTRKTKKHP